MAKAYWITTYRSVNDPEKVAGYVRLAGPAIVKAGGRFLVRGEPAAVFEAGLSARTVVVEFDSVEQAVSAYESPAYREALRALGDGAERDIRIVDGEPGH